LNDAALKDKSDVFWVVVQKPTLRRAASVLEDRLLRCWLRDYS
jgi:hypothetical protein